MKNTSRVGGKADERGITYLVVVVAGLNCNVDDNVRSSDVTRAGYIQALSELLTQLREININDFSLYALEIYRINSRELALLSD